MQMIDEVIVLGGGAIGSVYAAKLAARHPVTLIARPAHAEAIARARPARDRTRSRRRVACAPPPRSTAIAPGTLVLLTTKVNDSRAGDRAAGGQAARRHGDSVRPERAGQRGHRAGRTSAAAAWCCAPSRSSAPSSSEPGVVDFTAAGATLLEPSARSAEIAALLSASGLDGRVSDNIKIEIWRKLIFNCVINPITAIVGSEVRGIADPRLDPVKQLVVDECLQVAARRRRHLRHRLRADDRRGVRHGPHDRVDAAGPAERQADRDRSHERRGRRARARFGIACPVNAALVAIIKAMEARAVAQ